VQSGPAQARLGRVGRILRKKFFSNKNWILNIQRLWKFVGEDL
jgi:hypothetical protein